MDSSSYAGGDAAFLLGSWMNKFSFRHLPLLMMYWLQKDGAMLIPDAAGSSSTPEYYDIVNDNFAYFSSNASDG